MYGEAEFRTKVWGKEKNPDMIGLVAFVNGTTASNKDSGLGLFDNIDPAGGAGVRIMLNPKSRSTLSIDYAVGKYDSSGIYLILNDFF